MRALVTGANGFVGRHLFALLRERNDTVFAAGRAADGAVDYAIDLLDLGSLRDAIRESAPDLVFHLAAQSFVPDATRDPLATYDINVMGTARLFEAIRHAGLARAPRVIVASSAELYGARELGDYPLREHLAPSPANPYAASKAAVEAVTLAAARSYGIPAIVARTFNQIGPGQDSRFAVASFARQLAEIASGAPPQLYVGNLTARRDFTDVRDGVAAYVALAERGVAGEIYNVCSGTPVTLQEILRQLVMLARVPVEIREDPARMRPSDVPVLYGDPAKLETATGWTRTFTLARSLRDIIDDARARVAAAGVRR